MKGISFRGLHFLLFAAAALAVLPGLALAQGASTTGSGSGATHGQRGASKEQQDFNRKFQQLSDSLKLSEEQSPKVREIMEAEALKARQIKTKFKGTPDTPENRTELKKELDALSTETGDQLVHVLSPAQMVKRQQLRDEEVKKMKENEKAEKGEKPGDDH